MRSRASADLCIIDVDLPDGAGHELASEIGAAGEPMVFFSIYGDARNRLKALEAGAIEYLVKPIGPREFMLRVENILAQTRRPSRVPGPATRLFAGLRFEPAMRSLGGEHGEVKLTASECIVLQALTDRPYQTLGRTALAARVGPRGASRDLRVVDVLVYRLRRKLNALKAKPGIIVTVPSAGYALAAPVEHE